MVHPESVDQSRFAAEIERFDVAQTALEAGDLDQALAIFETLDYEVLEAGEPDEALAARVLALQLCVLKEKYGEALYHADAGLDLADNEPLLYHLAGQALWAEGHERTGAEMLVYAAELLDGIHDAEPPNFDVDQAQVYYLAAEACRKYDQESAAERFYQRALEFTRDTPHGSTS